MLLFPIYVSRTIKKDQKTETLDLRGATLLKYKDKILLHLHNVFHCQCNQYYRNIHNHLEYFCILNGLHTLFVIYHILYLKNKLRCRDLYSSWSNIPTSKDYPISLSLLQPRIQCSYLFNPFPTVYKYICTGV